MTDYLRPIRKPVEREHAERYVLMMLASFAASVVGTRLFLEIAGYPQLGNSELHIAHALWGGLALFIASLLPLVLVNRWVYAVSGVLSGIGVGLFIDEIGKFITQSNDYFYPFAAPIIYAFFLLTLFIYFQIRRTGSQDPRVELYRALDSLMEVLDHDLEPHEQTNLETRLRYVANQTERPDLAELAESLLVFLASGSIHLVPDKLTLWRRLVEKAKTFEERWISRRIHKTLLALGLGILGLFTLFELIMSLLALISPEILEQLAIDLLLTEQVTSATSFMWFMVRLSLEGLVGLCLLIAGGLLAIGREQIGYQLGRLGLLAHLTTISLLVFYFDQFSTVSLLVIQFVLLLAAIRYQQRYLARSTEEPDAH